MTDRGPNKRASAARRRHIVTLCWASRWRGLGACSDLRNASAARRPRTLRRSPQEVEAPTPIEPVTGSPVLIARDLRPTNTIADTTSSRCWLCGLIVARRSCSQSHCSSPNNTGSCALSISEEETLGPAQQLPLAGRPRHRVCRARRQFDVTVPVQIGFSAVPT